MKYLKLLLSIISLFIFLNIYAQKEGLEAIRQSDLKAGMDFFASDEMRGRETGTHENDIAALYLRTSIMQLGLKPVSATGDYFQQVPLISSEIKAGDTFIKGTDINGSVIAASDSICYLMAPSTSLEAASKLVFAGYGFSDTTSGYNDFEKIDIKDKIVMIMTGSPEFRDPGRINAVFDVEVEETKIATAFTHQVKGIIYVYDPRSKFPDVYSSGLAEMGLTAPGSKFMSFKGSLQHLPVQVAFITRYAANQLLKQDGVTLEGLQEKIIKEMKPVSFESGKVDVTFRTSIEETNIIANNVIGIIEGSDPVLKNECVIYTAHFDHVGVNKNGEAFNGADDNASGSISILEVAKAFMNLRKKPARSILFAWVNGEEKGLLGSQYYVENPVINMDKTILDINLDMVGRSKMPSDTGKFMGFDINISKKGEILLYTDQKGKDLLSLINSRSAESGIKSVNMGKDPEIGSSDYACFMAKGVPAIFFNSGDYPDLHTIHDDVEKIDFDKMERVTRLVFLIGYDIANQKKRFVPDTIN